MRPIAIRRKSFSRESPESDGTLFAPKEVMSLGKSNPFVHLPNVFWPSFQLLNKRQEIAN